MSLIPPPIPITQSIREISPSCWQLGAAMVCEKVTEPSRSGVITAWQDHESWFTIRSAQTTQDRGSRSPTSADVRLVHEAGGASAVWAIGNFALCKVKSRFENVAPEQQTIEYVREHVPGVPLPEVIHSWSEGNLSFLLLKRVQGMTLRDKWSELSEEQRDFVLKEIVRLCGLLASVTSTRIQNVLGGPLFEPYLAEPGTLLLGPLDDEESRRHFINPVLSSNPDPGNVFHLYHPNLGPGNIIIGANGQIAAIIDWEAAGFYPFFWISTKPSVSPGLDFHPPITGVEDIEWRRRLRTELEARGYPRFTDWFFEWMEANGRL